MALINNYVELRSSTFVGSEHLRRPIPVRVDSIGPWLECLRNLVRVTTAMGTGLVYFFRLRCFGMTPDNRQLAILCAIFALDVPRVFRWAVRFVVERVFWRGSEEKMECKEIDRRAGDSSRLFHVQLPDSDAAEDEDTDDFWKQDECPCEAFCRPLKST